jgi:hypothetical protein
MHNLNKIKVSVQPLAPSQGKHANVPNQFIWRTKKEFVGENEIVIADNQEAIWWNRPLTSEAMCKLEEDGIYSYNLPFWQGGNSHLIFKTGYNVLLNKNSVPVAIHVQTDETWSEEQIQLLDNMICQCLRSTLIELGVDEADLNHSKNDFYIKGKKFSCGEYIFENGVCTQNVIITLQMLPEKDIFDRLTGKYAHRKQITGIAEEVPSITKEAFIDKLYEKLQAYVEEHFN